MIKADLEKLKGETILLDFVPFRINNVEFYKDHYQIILRLTNIEDEADSRIAAGVLTQRGTK